MEMISDRILGNNNQKNVNTVDSLKDIEILGKYLKEEIDIEKNLEMDKDNYIELDEINMDKKKSNEYILGGLCSCLNSEGITTVIEKKVQT